MVHDKQLLISKIKSIIPTFGKTTFYRLAQKSTLMNLIITKCMIDREPNCYLAIAFLVNHTILSSHQTRVALKIILGSTYE